MIPNKLPHVLQMLYYYNQLSNIKDKSIHDVEVIKDRFFEFVEYTNQLNMLSPTEQHNLLKEFELFITDFQQAFQQAEFILEVEYARGVLAGEFSASNYLNERYKKIIHSEFLLFDKYLAIKKKRHILFAGSGPLPASAMLMALKDEDSEIYLLDNDEEAHWLAKRILHNYKSIKNLHLLQPNNVEDYPWINEFDVIILAGMIGATVQEKVEIYTKLAKNIHSGTYLFTRSSRPHDASILLYAPFPFEKLHNFYEKKEFKLIDPKVNVSNVVLQRK